MPASVLTQQALVLNKSWMAIATTSVKQAMRLAFKGSAKFIEPRTYEMHEFASWADLAVAPDEPCIRTVALNIRVPEIILLTGYGGVPDKAVTFTRRNLYRRDRNTCQYCGCKPGTSELSIDHVVPYARGGKNTWENCVLACMRCNRKKGSRLPAEAGLKLAREPFRPKWTPILEIPVGRHRESWEKFVSDRYWNTELQP